MDILNLNCLDYTKRECDIFKENISKALEDPLFLLKDLFSDNYTSIDLLMFSINKYGEYTLNEFQEELFKILIPYLRKFIANEKIGFEYNHDVFGSFIAFNYNNKPIFYIDIYNHKYIVKENEEALSLLNVIEEIDEEIDKLNKEIDDKMVLYDNPLLEGGANIFKIIDIELKKSKYKEKTLKDISFINNEISKLKLKKNELNMQKEESENNFLEISYIQDNLIRKFKSINYIELENNLH